MPRSRRKITGHFPTYKSLLLHLWDLRVTSGLTQEDVAKSIRVSRPQYNRIESGYSMISLRQLVYIAELYGKTLSALFEGVH